MANTMNTRPYYTITAKMGDWDLSNHLQKITVITSIFSPFQNVVLEFKINTKDAVLFDLLGKEDFDISIKLMTEDVIEQEDIQLTLVPIKNEIQMSRVDKSEQPHPFSDNIAFITIPKQPFKYMSTTVNRLFDNTSKKNPIEMVEDLISTFLPSMKTEIKKENINKEQITQFIVPPMTFMNAMRYIDGTDSNIQNKFGNGLSIFKGPMFFQCRFDEDTFGLWDLSKIIKMGPEYTIHHLTAGGNDSDIMKNSGLDGNEYYTSDPIKCINRGTQDLIKSSYEINYLSKPIDTLYKWHNFNIKDVFSESSINDGTDIYYHDVIKDRKEYHSFAEVGYEYSDVLYKNRIAKKLSGMSEIQFSMNRNLILTKLAKVGIPIKIEPHTDAYIDFRGKYIVSGSKIQIDRSDSDSWVCVSTIRALRGNLKT